MELNDFKLLVMQPNVPKLSVTYSQNVIKLLGNEMIIIELTGHGNQ